MTPGDSKVCSKEQQDKRSTLRVPLIVEKIPAGDGRRTFFGYARNLSRGGVFIATANPRQPGDQFDLCLTLPPAAGFTLCCRCEVVWQRPFEQLGQYGPGMGLRFLDLAPDLADALERWLQSLAAP